MKIIIALFAFVVIAAARPQDTKYTTKFDNVDVDEILKSDRLFNNYYKCLMDTGRCTPDGSELKRVLPDALENGCSKCSVKQREGSDKILRYISKAKKSQWTALKAKYDPTNKYITKYRAEAKSRGIDIE